MDEEKLKKAIRSAKASFEIEGLEITKENEKNAMDVLTGKITIQDLVEKHKMKLNF